MPAARRRLRGSHAADALRAAEGSPDRPQAHRGGQQGGQTQLPARRGVRDGVRPDVLAQRDGRPAGLPRGLRLGQERLDERRLQDPDRRHHIPARQDCGGHSGPEGHRRHAPDAHHEPRLLELYGPHRRGTRAPGPPHRGHARDDISPRRLYGEDKDKGTAHVRGHGTRQDARGAERRHLRHHRTGEVRDRRYHLRRGESGAPSADCHRRTDDEHALHHQRLAFLRPRG